MPKQARRFVNLQTTCNAPGCMGKVWPGDKPPPSSDIPIAHRCDIGGVEAWVCDEACEAVLRLSQKERPLVLDDDGNFWRLGGYGDY